MDHWSIKDLKTFCEQQGIDHRDCVEKPELVKVASAHAQGLFEAHRSGAKSREDSGTRSGGASATGASATGAGAAESAATAGGGRSSSEATGKARVNLEKLEVGARLYEKFAEASRALGLDDVGTSDAVGVPHHLAPSCAAAVALSLLLVRCRPLRLSTRSTRSWRASTTPIRTQTIPSARRPGASRSPPTPSLRSNPSPSPEPRTLSPEPRAPRTASQAPRSAAMPGSRSSPPRTTCSPPCLPSGASRRGARRRSGTPPRRRPRGRRRRRLAGGQTLLYC